MKIAFDLRRIKNPGIGRYMKCLSEAVVTCAPEHDYLLIIPPGAPELNCRRGGAVECICSRLPYYSVREQIEFPRLLRRRGVDVLHSPHFNVPLNRACPSVVTIHDVIYMACPGDLPSRLGRFYYNAMMQASVRRAGRVLTDSEFSRQEIIRYLHCDPGKIEVVYPAVDAKFAPVRSSAEVARVLARFGIDEDYILYTGIYKPRKNHAALLDAFQFFLNNGAQAKLVIAGPLDEGEALLRRRAAELGIAGRVVFTGFVSEEDLPALYTAARVYACPSLYEGFGFTVLEAMACGAPVVSSPETSLSEISGNAALFANPRKPEEFAAALHRVFFDSELRRELIGRGFLNVRRFSWADAAERVLAVYEQVACRNLEKAVYA